MLRRLEKGLNSAKIKSETTSPYHTDELRNPASQESSYSTAPSEPPYTSSTTHLQSSEIPSPNVQSYQTTEHYPPSSAGSRHPEMEDDDEDPDRGDEPFFPAKLIRMENQRNSFFRTILNPEEVPTSTPQRSTSFTPPHTSSPSPPGPSDPITAGIITEADAKMLFDAIFLRLNPFINLFDPALHTSTYVRSKCPFLFTTLIMAGCKFFKADKFKLCQKLASDFAIRAFADGWKRIEVVQAFACLTYWREPDDTVRSFPHISPHPS